MPAVSAIPQPVVRYDDLPGELFFCTTSEQRLVPNMYQASKKYEGPDGRQVVDWRETALRNEKNPLIARGVVLGLRGYLNDRDKIFAEMKRTR